MANFEVNRKLAAILAADVVEYSRLMGEDETGTLERLKSVRRKLVQPAITECGGRIVKLMGDGLLAEFPSVVDAVQCAVTIQESMCSLDTDLNEHQRIRLRIGINLGDILVEGSDIYGEGVNVAARLEGLADPGGICISDGVRLALGSKLNLEYEFKGEQSVKNIKEPISVYQIHLTSDASVGSHLNESPDSGVTEKPSIAVLPFTNMSGDPEQDFFSDGITEDVITELSRFQNLLVIARNSTFTYKDQPVKVQEVGRDLGVQYVVEGSVRKSGDRVRVTVQLIEAESGNHIWAERYDRELIDIFDIQDELTQGIVATLPGRIESASLQRLKRKLPDDLGAYERLLHAKILHHRGLREDNKLARQLLSEAINLDEEFAPAYAWKACVVSQGVSRGYIEESEELWSDVLNWAKKGYSIDENDLECVRIMCEYRISWMQWDEAEMLHQKAYQLNPNDPRIIAQRGELLLWQGEAEESLGWIEKAMQLDPYHADDWAHLLGHSLFGMHRYEDAIRAYMRVPVPRFTHYVFLSACWAYLGEVDKANIQKEKVLEMKSDFQANDFLGTLFYRNLEDRNHLLNGLIKAGLPK